VVHDKFGTGTVAAQEGNKLEIDFDTAGRKRVIDSFDGPAEAPQQSCCQHPPDLPPPAKARDESMDQPIDPAQFRAVLGRSHGRGRDHPRGADGRWRWWWAPSPRCRSIRRWWAAHQRLGKLAAIAPPAIRRQRAGRRSAALCRQLAGRGDKFAGWTTRFRPAAAAAGGRAGHHRRGIAWTHEAGDHDFVLGRVQAMAVQREGDPLLFLRGGCGGLRRRLMARANA
jgi:hypothetical protein